jgi:hypothetical protein
MADTYVPSMTEFFNEVLPEIKRREQDDPSPSIYRGPPDEQCCSIELSRLTDDTDLYFDDALDFKRYRCTRSVRPRSNYCYIHRKLCINSDIKQFWANSIHGSSEVEIVSLNLINELEILARIFRRRNDICILSVVKLRAERLMQKYNIDDVYYCITLIFLSLELMASMRIMETNLCFINCPNPDSAGHANIIKNNQRFGNMIFPNINSYIRRLNPISLLRLINSLLIQIDDNLQLFSLSENELDDYLYNYYTSDVNTTLITMKKNLYKMYHSIKNYYSNISLDDDNCIIKINTHLSHRQTEREYFRPYQPYAPSLTYAQESSPNPNIYPTPYPASYPRYHHSPPPSDRPSTPTSSSSSNSTDPVIPTSQTITIIIQSLPPDVYALINS